MTGHCRVVVPESSMGRYSISAGADSPATAVLGCVAACRDQRLGCGMTAERWRAVSGEVQKRKRERRKQIAAFQTQHLQSSSHKYILNNRTIRSHNVYPSNRSPLYPVSNLKIQDFIQLSQPRLCSIAIHHLHLKQDPRPLTCSAEHQHQ